MKCLPFFCCFLLAFASCTNQQSPCVPANLVCEYLVDPIGLDNPQPRLKWQLKDARPGARQQAYSIRVGTDSAALARGEGNQWNLPKTEGDAMLVAYEGEPLKPFTKYFWAVQVWDQDGKASPLSSVASFETGMMDMKNWQGDWITDTEDIDLRPAPYFRKVFQPRGKVKSARVYMAAAGLYELYINGQLVGDHRLNPIYTRFDRRNLYVTHDITSLLGQDSVAIGVLLGNGWYNHQSTAVWDFHKALWRARPRFCLNLRIVYENGEVETIASGQEWRTNLSPVIFNSIYTAEHYDARLEQPGWNRSGFDDTHWKKAMRVAKPSDQIVAQALHPIRDVEAITPVSMRKINDRKYLYDLGKNISGVSLIKVKGERGTTLRLTHAEVLDSMGNIDLSNIDVHYRPTDDSDPFQTDIFILGGAGAEETFRPRFNYKGFQYVEVESDRPVELTQNSLTGLFMHSDVPTVGHLQSSNETIDKIWQAANSSYLANLFGYPTDCPQREKNGWTGDAHIASETGLYNFDGITIYEKWLADHQDEQRPDGVLPAIIPTAGWGYQWANGPDWTSTIAIIPWNIYLFYGDAKLLKDCYENIRLYVDHITEISPSGLTDWGLGDWVPVKSVTPKEFTSSIYYFVDASILAKAAKLLGKEADAEKYSALAQKIADAINAKYLDKESGLYGSGFQTEQSAALFWGVVPELQKQKVAEQLARRVIADDQHIDVGLLGTKTILNALSENGYSDLAFTVAAQETFPSWGWWIKNGATTLFENWPIDAKSDISRNHIMFGEINAWFYKALGGIKPDPAQPGFRNVLLEPHFVEGLQHFEASYNGPYGKIVSAWKRSGGQVVYQVVIPANSTATLTLKAKKITEAGKEIKPASGQLELAAGSYEFTVEPAN